jgi:hypothetical protein
MLNIVYNNWLALDGKEETCHFLFRKTLAIHGKNAEGKIAITAGSVYRLYINEKVVMIGPARGISKYFLVDIIDITKWLRVGENTFAIEVAYYPNSVPRNIQYEFPLHEGGLGLCLNVGNQNFTLHDGWKTTRLEAFEANAPWCRGLVSEKVLAAEYPSNWYSAGFDDNNWEKVAPARINQSPVDLHERPIPLPFIAEKLPLLVKDFGFLQFPDQYSENPIPVHLLAWFGARQDYMKKGLKEVLLKPPQLDRVQYRRICNAISGGTFVYHPNALLREDNNFLTMKGTIGSSGYVVYDLGENSTGSVYIEAQIPRDGRVDVNMTEWLDNEWGNPSDNRQRLFNPMVSHGGFSIIGDGNTIHFTSMQKHNFRYICIVSRDLPPDQHVIVKKLSLIEYSLLHDADTKADVTCSDPVLNNIIDACKRTIRINAHDGYVDCTCERIVTSGDCLQSSEAGRLFYGKKGREISVNMFNLMIDQGMGDGARFPNLPKGRCSAITLAEGENMLWMLAPCMFILDMIAWANETSACIPEKYKETMRGVATDIKNNLNKDGLIPSMDAMSNWSDWSKMVVSLKNNPNQEGISTSVNAFYYRMLQECAKLLPGETVFDGLAEKIGTGLRKLCSPSIYTGNERVFRFVPDFFVYENDELVPFRVEGMNVFGTQQRVVSETTQYWLLWSGVLSREEEQLLWDVLRGWNSFELPVRDNTRMLNPSRSSSVMGLCPRFRYMLENNDSKLYHDARHTFGPNVARDKTLWESLELDSRSSAHVTTTYTGIVLYRSLTGIKPGDDPGSVTIEPLIDDSLEWARGYKETSQGTIGVSWRRGEQKFILRVTLPGNMEARIKLPEPVIGYLIKNGHAIAENGIYHVNQSIEIVADKYKGVELREIV